MRAALRSTTKTRMPSNAELWRKVHQLPPLKTCMSEGERIIEFE